MCVQCDLFILLVRIKEDSFKYFGRSLAECELGCERLEDSLANFSDIGSDISEVGKQLIQLKVEQKRLKDEIIGYNNWLHGTELNWKGFSGI